MKFNKETLYWSRGCLTAKNSQSELCCKSVKDCHKLTVYNWLKDIPLDRVYDIYEIRFKNTRKCFFRNVNNLNLKEGDIVAVEASPGHDIGIVSALGHIAEIKFRKSGQDPLTAELKKIYRLAKPGDIEKWQEAVSLEYSTMIRSRKHASALGLNMKIGDVEYQGDKTKAIFYYIADERVDFRELIKVLAEDFRIRIEMRQIGARQEAGLIGGIGPCGRELCCAQWMTNFVSVTTNSARYQDISVNPLKLAGQCGKLKCCLNYELETYLDALKAFPQLKEPLQTTAGYMYVNKVDALKGIMWFSSSQEHGENMTAVTIERVNQIIILNKKGIKVESLMETSKENEVSPGFRSAVGEDSLTRFDKSKKKKKVKKAVSREEKQVQEIDKTNPAGNAEVVKEEKPKQNRLVKNIERNPEKSNELKAVEAIKEEKSEEEKDVVKKENKRNFNRNRRNRPKGNNNQERKNEK